MKKTFTTLLVACFAFHHVSAQTITEGSKGMYPEMIDFSQKPIPFQSNRVVLQSKNGSITSSYSNRKVVADKDNLGMDHIRYQQVYNGFPVQYAIYIAHVKSGNLISQNGQWVRDFPADIKNYPVLSNIGAFNKALQFMGAAKYKWEVPEEENYLKAEKGDMHASYFPQPELVYYSGEDVVTPSKLRLAYKFDIYAHMPLDHRIVFVDAENGGILGFKSMMHFADANGSAATAYSGTKSIVTDYTGSAYRLREAGRGNGIETYDMRTAGTTYGNAVDFTDADNSWNNVNSYLDQYATDAHWGAEMTYDYFKNTYNRNSIDNAGYALKSYVHVQLTAFGYPNNVNAFWDGSKMSYGDGNTTYKPLTSLDIAGHEITHGLTTMTSNLNYSNESGALNEGFSDIFGTAIEFYGRPERANWTIGEDIGASFRSMSNPNAYSQPDTYQGTYWYTGTGDYGGVHTNSGVLNFWFYLLVQGGSGTNDNGAAYNVTGLGMTKAAAIAFRTNTVYLTSTSNYASARTYSIKSAEDLYGVGSTEAITVSCAWAAVNVGACNTAPPPPACSSPTGLAATSITSGSATLSWTAVSGAASYNVEYKTTAGTTWTVAANATTATSVSLSGLTASTSYDWRVITNCASSSSAATASSFTTLQAVVTCASAFEPNETLATAAAITSGATNTAAISSSTDIDYFKITTTAASSNSYVLSGPSGVDYDMYIYNSSGTQVGAGTGSSASESVTLSNQAAGTYYIKIIGYNGQNSTTCYTIKATATIITSCSSTYDNSTNGAYTGAAQIPLNTDIKGLINTSSDVDYYKFVITTGGTATITLTTLPADYDVKLYSSSGSTLLATSQNGGTSSESITRTYTAGTYYIRVYGYSGVYNTTNCYTLKVATGTATIAGDIPIADIKPELEIYPNPVTTTLNIKATAIDLADAKITIADTKGNIVIQENMTGTNKSVQTSKLASGVYILRFNNGKETYTQRFVKL